ncbi:HD-GYP domain-containing protein [Halomonas sp. GXIMD04776]|uniref:HD-GYP domain-containing protein n=1 Tax=Halomonas sp. GXIMD04776 TaxID=3415605 RepID=UPI003CC634AF
MQQVSEPDSTLEHLIGVPVEQLQSGMYVAALDRPWIETPFMLEGLLLQETKDLQALRHFCKKVYVDPSRSSPEAVRRLRTLSVPSRSQASSAPATPRLVYPIKRTVEQEFSHSRGDYQEAKQMVHRLLRDEQNWHRNLPDVKHMVGRFADSILSNPSALNWLARIKHESEYTAEHCLNVGVVAMIFGRHLGFERSQIEELGLAGMLHDVGKMKLDQTILNKPGKLTEEEFAHIKTHVLEGYAMLKDEQLSLTIKEACRDHHERLNGTGYPSGKRQEEIDCTARIIAIVDTYDAITSDRVYGPARPTAEALDILYKLRCTHYDEELVIRFIECIGIYPPGSIVELHNGMIAVVLSVEPNKRLKPKILVMLDEDKNPIHQTTLDLADPKVFDDKRLNIKKVLPPGSYNIHLEGLMERLLQPTA